MIRADMVYANVAQFMTIIACNMPMWLNWQSS